MARLDLPLDELRRYRSSATAPADFDDFWRTTLAEARDAGGEVTLEPMPSPFRGIEVFDIRFPGFAGDPIAGWLLVPHGAADAPAVVVYQGYGGGRGLPHEWLAWPSAGYVTLVTDTRGQGSAWGSGGVTPDPHGSPPAIPGVMTRGIASPDTYYYRRVFTDGVRAVDAVRAHPAVDAAKVIVAGGSQGGGITLAVAGLADGIAAALPDVPFLCDFPRAVGFTDEDPYDEIVRHLRVHRDRVDEVFHTLSYMDGTAFAARASAPALFSVALQDPICPPSTVFGAFHAYAGPKEIDVFPFNRHEGGGTAHWPRQHDFVRDVLNG